MTTNLVHYFAWRSSTSRTACGLRWADLFGVGRINKDISKVTCQDCLATDEGRAELMEHALAHPEKANMQHFTDLVKKQQDEILEKYRARYNRWIIPPHQAKLNP